MALNSEGSVENELRLAQDAYRAGNLGGAQTRIDTLVRSHPHRADVQLASGIIQLASGNPSAGLESLKNSLSIQPNSGEALAWAIHAAQNLQDFEQAEVFARRLTQVDPQNPKAYFFLANALRALDRYEEGLQAIDRALELKPDDTESLVTKARLLRQWDMPALAIDIYRKVLSIRPSPPASVDLAKILLKENHPQEALDVLENAMPLLRIEQRPHALIAQAYTEMRRFDEAAEHWTNAEKYSQDREGAIQSRATAEIAVGRFEVAEELLMKALNDEPAEDPYFAILTTARKLKPEDLPLIERMEAIASGGSIEGIRLANLNYALGKSFDDLKQYDRAIHYFDEANRICREVYPKRRNFSREFLSQFIDFQIETFTGESIQELSELGLPNELPLFVVGMIRSGTTLTESILSAHSLVAGGGEQAFWPEHAAELFYTGAGLEFKHAMAMRFAGEYLKSIDPGDDRIRHVVDKNPTNFDLTGMLASLYSQAKFVHVKRNAVDNLLSMWMTPVSGSVGWASSRENLVFVYREYLRLFKHWQEAMPSDRFATFRYEDLTSHPDETIRAMLKFVGLEPEAACFAPEKNIRAVLTPSVQQVRQPIHEGSQARWKNYEPWLGPFAELMEELP